MAISEFPQLRASLSYSEIERATGWKSPVIINDYLNISEESNRIIGQVDENTNAIASNIISISENASGIITNSDNLNAHILSSSEHGVTGDNVGNEDFSSSLIGGVVLLMNLVADAVASTEEITLSDLVAAPVSYDQSYTNLQSSLINDVKAKHNAMLADLNSSIVQLNELISSSITAKQMSPT